MENKYIFGFKVSKRMKQLATYVQSIIYQQISKSGEKANVGGSLLCSGGSIGAFPRWKGEGKARKVNLDE